MEKLYVLRDNFPIATIESHDRQTWHFAFTRQGIEAGIEISNSFSIDDEIDQSCVKNWFCNLLPEGQSRERLVASERIADNDFAILKHIGLDCAGALTISDTIPAAMGKIPRKTITRKQLEQWSREDARVELNIIAQEKTRMSLAGAQRKWAVIFEQGEYYFPGDDEPSTHIIKAANNHAIILGEVYMNTLAELFGLTVPPCHIDLVGKGLFFCIERYDRALNNGQITRIHQEDMCQVLGLPASRKYQADMGPTFGECIAAIKRYSTVSAPIIDVIQLIRWQIFNVICGNSDGHAKNISLLQNHEGKWQLAPLYDLVSTQALQIYRADLAFSVGTNFMPGSVRASDWHAMADECEITRPQMVREVKQALVKLNELNASDTLKHTLETRGVTEDYWNRLEQVKLYIEKQCRRIDRQLT
jgi:serine/threonine-protein kinase HipA